MIKMVATDIDGTLLKSDKTFSSKTKSVIENLSNKEVAVVLVTSRPLNELPRDVMDSGLIRYTINSNGAIVYDHLKGETVCTCIIPHNEAMDVINHVRDTKAVLTVATASEMITDRGSFQNIVAKSEDERLFIEGIFEKSRPVYDTEDFEQKIRTGHGVEKIHLNYGTVADKMYALNHLKQVYGDKSYHFTSSDPQNLEITHAQATKLSGVLNLSQHLNIPNESILTIGDGENDTEMFSVSEHAVAMLNASDDVKFKAKFITEYDNDNDGWALFIARYINV